MRVIIQRVRNASVTVDEKIISSIDNGILVLAGIEENDKQEDVNWISAKIVNLRIFDDNDKIPNLSVKDVNGEILLVSQFTLHALTKKGNRPSYIRAARPEIAIPLYENLIQQVQKELGKTIQTGIFGADMKVSLLNDGPLTIWMDSKARE